MTDIKTRLLARAKTMNGRRVGAGDGHTTTLGYYDRDAMNDDTEAAATISALERRVEELEGNAKCGCAVDRPDDVCVFHAAKYAEVRRVAFEDAARIADEAKDMRQRLFDETRASLNASKAAMAEQIADDIRALSKGTGE